MGFLDLGAFGGLAGGLYNRPQQSRFCYSAPSTRQWLPIQTDINYRLTSASESFPSVATASDAPEQLPDVFLISRSPSGSGVHRSLASNCCRTEQSGCR